MFNNQHQHNKKTNRTNSKRTSSQQAKNLTCVWYKVCTPSQHSIASQVSSRRDWYHPHWGQSPKLISDGWSSHIVLHSVTYGIPMVIYAITTMSREHRYIHHLTARGMLWFSCNIVISMFNEKIYYLTKNIVLVKLFTIFHLTKKSFDLLKTAYNRKILKDLSIKN